METLKNLTIIQWIGIAVGLNSLLMGATPQLTVLFGEHAVPYIIAVATLGNGALGVFVTVIGGQGSQVRNVLAMPGVEKIAVNGQASSALATLAIDPLQSKISPTPAAMDRVTATAKAFASILLVAFVVPLFLAGGSAQAQVRKPVLTGNIVADIAAAKSNPSTLVGSIDGAVSDFNAQVQKITKDVVDKAIADVTAAQTDAQNHNDQISKPCWDANLALLKSLPTQWENPPTFPVGLALGVQIQRDLLNSITGNDAGSLKVACAALLGDQLKIVANLGGLLGIKIATGGLF